MHTTNTYLDFTRSNQLRAKFNALIPGGSHTYSKGDDQWPEFAAPYIARGKGCHVWDIDGNEFIEYGMGLRSVTLGHGYEPVVEAVKKQLPHGSNFVRPAAIELECAEQFLSMISGAEMVKFGKNGSDATTAAVKLARAYTGRDLIAICGDHPFFSIDDWFIGTTKINAGIPSAISDLTLKFSYNQIESVQALFEAHPGQIACVLLEAERWRPPTDQFLQQLKDLCHK
ncbi:MAG: aminotransferase class III-fold pyridoxal phosphate-dependent enzyme, partial [Bacteroidetes bacterium]